MMPAGMCLLRNPIRADPRSGLRAAKGSDLKAKVTASTITIAGELDGEVLCHGVFQIMPSGQVSASVSARRLIVQEGGLYNGEFRMITDSTGFKSDREPAVSAKGSEDETSSSLDTLKSDEWWRKFQAGEPVEPEPGDNEGPAPKGGKAKH
jgi:hypothetical protein